MDNEAIIQEIYEAMGMVTGCVGDVHAIADHIARGTGGREVALAITNLQQARMWLKQAVEELLPVVPTEGTSNVAD